MSREADWNDLCLRMETAAIRLEQKTQEIMRHGQDSGYSIDQLAEATNRLKDKRAGVLLCLDYMRGYPEGKEE